jgi:ketosteroid isomerase-like protein
MKTAQRATSGEVRLAAACNHQLLVRRSSIRLTPCPAERVVLDDSCYETRPKGFGFHPCAPPIRPFPETLKPPNASLRSSAIRVAPRSRMNVMDNENQKNIEKVTGFYEAIAQGDLAMARKVLDRDVEWIESDRTALWSRGPHRGACAVFNDLILPAYNWFANFRIELDRFISVGEHVVVVGRFRGRTKTTSKELNAPTTHIWTLRNGKAIRVQAYNEPAKWTQALNDSDIEALAV